MWGGAEVGGDIRVWLWNHPLETGDDVRIRHLLGSGDLKQMVAFAEGFDLVAIDEAQQIPDIGMGLKILVDHLPNLRIFATGSSSFDLAGYTGIYGTFHFWRTYDGKEIDYVEDRDGELFGFECKWPANQRVKPPLKWLESYPVATFELVTPDKYFDFVA